MDSELELKNEEVNESAPKIKRGHKYPTFVDLVGIFGFFILAQLLAFFCVNFALPHIILDLSSDMLISWTMLLSQIISMTAVIIFITFLRRSRNAERPALSFSLSGFNPTVLLGGFLMMLSSSVVLEPLLALLPAPPEIEAHGWPMLVAVVFGAPIFEEVICRGMIFGSLRKKSGVVAAVLISSLFFGLMHLHPSMIVNASIMGIILCYIYIRSGSLLAPIILHSLNNAIGYLMIILGWGGNIMLRDLISSQTIYIIVYCTSVVVFLISALICVRAFRKIIAETKQ